jgi:hypothetical protein
VKDATNYPLFALAGIAGWFTARAFNFNPWLGALLGAGVFWLWLKKNPTPFEAMNTLQENSNTAIP